MKAICFVFLILFFSSARGQDELDLKECMEAALNVHARAGDRQLIESLTDNAVSVLNSQWKPSVDMIGQMTYQSDVIELGVELPLPGVSFPVAPRDQYKLYLDVRQTLYDGGRIRQQKEMEMLSGQADILRTETEMESIKSEIIELYYSILLIQENLSVLDLMKETLSDKREVILSGIRNGIMSESDLYMIDIELKGLEQEKKAALLQKSSLFSVLSEKTQLSAHENTQLRMAGLEFVENDLNRKELLLFDLQVQNLEAARVMNDKNRMPLLFAFGQFGYGNPGLNMLKDEFDTWYYVGAGLKWNIWDWNASRKKKESLVYQAQLIENRKSDFENNIHAALIRQENQVYTHIENIKAMEEMEKLRIELSAVYESRLNEGIIKPADYLEVVNKLKITRFQLAAEKVQLQKSIALYLFFNGQL